MSIKLKFWFSFILFLGVTFIWSQTVEGSLRYYVMLISLILTLLAMLYYLIREKIKLLTNFLRYIIERSKGG